MKKILMFQDYFYIGGIEKVILDIKNNINNYYKIDILSFANKSNDAVKSLLNKNYRSFIIRNILGIFKLKKYLKNNKYDIIHIHCYNSFGLIYAYITYKYNKNIILHGHNSNIDKDFLYIKHIINNIIKLLFKSNKYNYIAVSKESNKLCFNNEKCIIIKNGIDYKKYKFNNEERKKYRSLYKIKDNEIVIGNIGRFEYQKNHAFIIDIFNEINKINNNYKLILIGEGTLKNKIINKIKKLKLESKIIILDYRDDINKLINMFDIYLFPSIYEGFGLTVVENEINGKYVYISNKVSKDVVISNRIKYIFLNKNRNYWANEIINKKDINLKLDNKLDIKYFINNIEDIYNKVNNN